jgi:hypothetical protein
MKLKERFESIANLYLIQFVNRYYKFDDGSQADSSWLSDEPGTIAFINDEVYGFDDIRYCVDNDVDDDQLFSWYEYTLRIGMIDDNLPKPNLRSWIAGCPRMSEAEIEDLEEHKKRRQDIENEFRELIKKYTEK